LSIKNNFAVNIYITIEPYLKDILEDPPVPQDERPQYQNQSSGYLQFRNLNQGIIIRNTQSPTINELDANTKQYLNTGFTITMWTKFLDKTSEGTLFNFGNPFRMDDTAFGFALETYVIKGNEMPLQNGLYGQTEGDYIGGFGFSNTAQGTWRQIFRNGSTPDVETFSNLQTEYSPFFPYSGMHSVPNENFFETTDTERFVRLVVRENDGRLRGSHVGMPFMCRRRGLPQFGYGQDFHSQLELDSNDPSNYAPYDHAYGLMTNTLIPYNPDEWYFICATYNPSIPEDGSHEQVDQQVVPYVDDLSLNKDFWLNHIITGEVPEDDESPNPTNLNYVAFSNFGNKCKVEIISRSDLLRARGFRS